MITKHEKIVKMWQKSETYRLWLDSYSINSHISSILYRLVQFQWLCRQIRFYGKQLISPETKFCKYKELNRIFLLIETWTYRLNMKSIGSYVNSKCCKFEQFPWWFVSFIAFWTFSFHFFEGTKPNLSNFFW